MTKFLNISTDNTLGGNSPSNEIVSSQKAIKEYVDNHGGGGGGAVDSVNGQTGTVVLDAEDVGAVDKDVFLGPYYGTCSTGASVADKVVSCPELPDFSSGTETIKNGTTINVKFTNGQSIDDGAIRLNVNNYGFITVEAYYSYLPYNAWRAGEVVSFVYDGYWQLVSPEWVWVASNLDDEIDARIDMDNELSDALSNEVSRAKGAEQRIEGLIPTQASDIGAVAANTAITGATKCKITYDSKGLVTAGADLASSDITTALGYTPYNSSNPSGYITGITSSDVTTALGFTPYDASNPNGYTSNVGTVTSVNNVSPVNGNVSLTIPTVNNPTITITQGGVTKGSFTLNQSSGDTIALDAGGGSSLPSQTGHAGDFLTTDGTDASWATVYAMQIIDYTED